MDLADFLLELATSYDRLAGVNAPAQTMLSDASLLLAEHCPAGMVIQSGGGKGMATYTPWVGFFDPDVTDSPQRGVYLVYIMSEELEMVALTLNQGMEYLRKEFGDKGAPLSAGGRSGSHTRCVAGSRSGEVRRSDRPPIEWRPPEGLRGREHRLSNVLGGCASG
jgi:hypothetical protein